LPPVFCITEDEIGRYRINQSSYFIYTAIAGGGKFCDGIGMEWETMNETVMYICDLCGKRVYMKESDDSPAICLKCGRVIKRKFLLEAEEEETES
jgi:DNA-directed RNA polymerase subunit RPC12/RpoP